MNDKMLHQPPLSKLHVLVVEDEKFMRNLIQRLLYELQTGKITKVENGEEGLKALAKKSSQVDLVLLDIEMPDMNGLEFLKHVRNSRGTLQDPNVRVIMLTGHSRDDQVQQAVELGIEGYLLKPISKTALLNRIVHSFQ